MSDDWRSRRRDDDEDFGPPLFGDDADDAARDDLPPRRLSFGANDTGPLPHWTDPPTGEVPKLEPIAPVGDDDDEVDVWSTFSTESPVWRDDETSDTSGSYDSSGSFDVPPSSGSFERGYDPSGGLDRGAFETTGGYDRTGDYDRTAAYDTSGSFDASGSFDDPGYGGSAYGGSAPPPPAPYDTGSFGRDDLDRTGQVRATEFDFSGSFDRPADPPSGSVPRGRITIGTDPSGSTRRIPPAPGRRSARTPTRGGRPAGPARTAASSSSGRDMPVAIGVGLAIAALFIIAVKIKPVAVLVLVTVILGIAAWEFYGKVIERGLRPSVAAGMAACVGMPLAAYWVGGEDGGNFAIPLVVFLALAATIGGFVGAPDREFRPLTSAAVTMLGVVWIGVLGTFAVLILNYSTIPGFSNPYGTDTLVLIVIGVVANDVGALAVGSTFGKTPLREWISPHKTLEGFLGGAVCTILAMVLFHVWGGSDTWTKLSDLLIVGVVIAVLAPLGDMAESMFKRELDVKDFGAIIPGHGGVLDRFDSFLFVLPAVYYLIPTILLR